MWIQSQRCYYLQPYINYYDDIQSDIVDTLVISLQTTEENNLGTVHVSIQAWGDNSYGQLDIPFLSGHYEGFEAGGFHNTIATTENIFMLEQGSTMTMGLLVLEEIFFLVQQAENNRLGKNDLDSLNFPLSIL